MTILRPSYLHNGISYAGEMTSLYWIGAQGIGSRGPDLVLRNIPASTPEGLTLDSLQNIATFCQPFWKLLFDQRKLVRNFWQLKKIWKIKTKLIICIDGAFGARTSADTVMTQVGSHSYTELALLGLTFKHMFSWNIWIKNITKLSSSLSEWYQVSILQTFVQ